MSKVLAHLDAQILGYISAGSWIISSMLWLILSQAKDPLPLPKKNASGGISILLDEDGESETNIGGFVYPEPSVIRRRMIFRKRLESAAALASAIAAFFSALTIYYSGALI